MFKKMPGPVGFSGDRLGLWEYQSATEATELIHHRRDQKDAESVNREQQRPILNLARQSTWGK